MFSKAIVLFAVLVVTLASASAAPEAPHPRASALAVVDAEKFVAIKTVESPVGQLVYYALAAGENANATTGMLKLAGSENEKRCGSNQVHCDGGNAPNADPCAALIFNGLQTDHTVFPNAVSAVCLTTSGQCCISWREPTSGLQHSSLFNAAAATFNGCVVHGNSGYSVDTNLHGVCTNQCLSNRPGGC